MQNDMKLDGSLVHEWFSEIEKDIYTFLDDDKYFDICKRFDLFDDNDIPSFLQTKIELQDIASKFNKNYNFIPKSFLIASAVQAGMSIEDMMTKDYITQNLYNDKMNYLYVDVDGIGILKSKCKHEVFKGEIKGLTTGEAYRFEQLLSSSISMDKGEKKAVVRNIDELNIFQIKTLIEIFEEEVDKFANLGLDHMKQLSSLAKQHEQNWYEIIDEIEKERIILKSITDEELIYDKNDNFTPQAILSYLNETVK